MTGAVVRNLKTNDTKLLAATGLFVAIGHTPSTSLLQGRAGDAQNGYLKTEPGSTAPTSRACSPAATCRTATTGRPSPRARAAWRPSTPSAWLIEHGSQGGGHRSAKQHKPKTVAVHAGAPAGHHPAHPVVPPIHVSAVSYFDSSDELDAALDGKDYVYSRIAAPNTALLEEAVAALEGAEACVAYAAAWPRSRPSSRRRT